MVDVSKDTTEIIIEPGRHDIVFRRVFDAPRDVVYRALTDSQLIPNWWGPGYLSTAVDAMEVRHGGRWRFIQKDPENNEFAFRGVYHEVTPERMIQTFEWEGLPGHVSLETLTLEERMVASGMEAGFREGMLRLDEVIAGLLSRV